MNAIVITLVMRHGYPLSSGFFFPRHVADASDQVGPLESIMSDTLSLRLPSLTELFASLLSMFRRGRKHRR